MAASMATDNMDGPGQEFYQIGQVARRLGLSQATVRKLVERGVLHAVRICRHYYFTESALYDATGSRERLMHSGEAADYLGVCIQTINARANSGAVPCVDLGSWRIRRFRREDLERIHNDTDNGKES